MWNLFLSIAIYIGPVHYAYKSTDIHRFSSTDHYAYKPTDKQAGLYVDR